MFLVVITSHQTNIPFSYLIEADCREDARAAGLTTWLGEMRFHEVRHHIIKIEILERGHK
jgi:hypothetical protein